MLECLFMVLFMQVEGDEALAKKLQEQLAVEDPSAQVRVGIRAVASCASLQLGRCHGHAV